MQTLARPAAAGPTLSASYSLFDGPATDPSSFDLDAHPYILRATPTAAGPSSSKRSVLWRTRGFAALGFDCCVVVGAVSGACFV